MDLTKYRNKLIGSKEERAVSPVIGVILMVAITVILAAVIAAFVLDLGDSMGESSVNAGVSTDVSDSEETITITVNEMGDADRFEIRGDIEVDGTEIEDGLAETGDSFTIANSEGDGEGDVEPTTDSEGEANVVAISGDSESVVSSFEWEDWEEDPAS